MKNKAARRSNTGRLDDLVKEIEVDDGKLGRAAPRGKARDHFYKRDPALARRGKRGLTLEEKAVYDEIIDLTYEFGRAPVNDPERMAHACECHKRVFVRVRDQLVQKGRIAIVDGRLVDERSLELLAERAAEHQQAVENGSVGGRKSAQLRSGTGSSRGDDDEIAGSSGDFNGPDMKENREKSGGGLNQVESESESDSPDSDSILVSFDLTGLPPIDADSPLNSNIVPIGMAPTRCYDPTELHSTMIAIAGPHLKADATLKASIGFIAQALVAGCDPDLDMIPVVVERSHSPRARPITTWAYFCGPWTEHRDRRLNGGKKRKAVTSIRRDNAA